MHFYWLIEKGPDSQGKYWWWTGRWVDDPQYACWFLTQEDAEKEMKKANIKGLVVQHGFAM